MAGLTRPLSGSREYSWHNVTELSRVVMTRGSPINFSRPQHSRCLTGFSDKTDSRYAEALAIIRSGKEQLVAHPRRDMPGFQPAEFDRARFDYYTRRQQTEALNRRAIVAGKRAYDNRP